MEKRFTIGNKRKTWITNSNNIWQDGCIASAVDKDGMLYAILGHTNLGGVSLWKGHSILKMEHQGAITCNFSLGSAGTAFNGVPYPDGPLSRGEIWICGLWIDPQTDLFYGFVHNETGWGAGETNYTVDAFREGEPDFRHIGLIKSRDKGKTWDFEKWIITSQYPSWTEACKPREVRSRKGQSGEMICLGSGDFSLYPDIPNGYLYIFYSQIFIDSKTKDVAADRIYAARALLPGCGGLGDWKKFYDGDFAENGNCGKETPVMTGNIPYVTYNSYLNKYLMTSYNRSAWYAGKGALQVSLSSDLTCWTEPDIVDGSNNELSLPYFSQFPSQSRICYGNLHTTGKEFFLLGEGNGTDVSIFSVAIG